MYARQAKSEEEVRATYLIEKSKWGRLKRNLFVTLGGLGHVNSRYIFESFAANATIFTEKLASQLTFKTVGGQLNNKNNEFGKMAAGGELPHVYIIGSEHIDIMNNDSSDSDDSVNHIIPRTIKRPYGIPSEKKYATVVAVRETLTDPANPAHTTTETHYAMSHNSSTLIGLGTTQNVISGETTHAILEEQQRLKGISVPKAALTQRDDFAATGLFNPHIYAESSVESQLQAAELLAMETEERKQALFARRQERTHRQAAAASTDAKTATLFYERYAGGDWRTWKKSYLSYICRVLGVAKHVPRTWSTGDIIGNIDAFVSKNIFVPAACSSSQAPSMDEAKNSDTDSDSEE